MTRRIPGEAPPGTPPVRIEAVRAALDDFKIALPPPPGAEWAIESSSRSRGIRVSIRYQDSGNVTGGVGYLGEAWVAELALRVAAWAVRRRCAQVAERLRGCTSLAEVAALLPDLER